MAANDRVPWGAVVLGAVVVVLVAVWRGLYRAALVAWEQADRPPSAAQVRGVLARAEELTREAAGKGGG